MVNTFFVHENVYISAKCLDKVRLNKQTSECITIYRKIMSLKLLGAYYHTKFPTDYELYDWVREVVAKYKIEGCIFVFRENGQLDRLPNGIKLIHQSYNQEIIYEDDMKVKLKDDKGKTVTINKSCFAGLNDIPVKLGYIYHPAVLLWFNYLSALKHYTMVHIEECKARGMQNSITLGYEYFNKDAPICEVSSSVNYPPWTKDGDFLIRHRSNLIRKDKEYYAPIFPTVANDMQYFWPYANKVSSKNGIADNQRRYLKLNN
jgi:hypothetical protein